MGLTTVPEANTKAYETLQSQLGNLRKATPETEVVELVISGKYGSGEERKAALVEAGYDPQSVQNAVNEKLGIGDIQADQYQLKPGEAIPESLLRKPSSSIPTEKTKGVDTSARKFSVKDGKNTVEYTKSGMTLTDTGNEFNLSYNAGHGETRELNIDRSVFNQLQENGMNFNNLTNVDTENGILYFKDGDKSYSIYANSPGGGFTVSQAQSPSQMTSTESARHANAQAPSSSQETARARHESGKTNSSGATRSVNAHPQSPSQETARARHESGKTNSSGATRNVNAHPQSPSQSPTSTNAPSSGEARANAYDTRTVSASASSTTSSQSSSRSTSNTSMYNSNYAAFTTTPNQSNTQTYTAPNPTKSAVQPNVVNPLDVMNTPHA